MKMMKKTVKATLALVLLCSAVFAQNLADARKAIDAEQYQKAKNILKNLISSKPGDAENYFYLGNIYLTDDYIDSAKAVFTKGVSADAEFALNYVGLGAVDLLSNNKTAAKANFEKAQSLVKKKDDGPALYTGKAYILAKDYDAALTYLESGPKAAKVINPKDAEVYVAIGDAYRDRKTGNDLSTAYSNYQTAIEMDKDLIRPHLELAIIQKRAFAWNGAVDAFNAIIQANPTYGPAYRELAETYRDWAIAEPKDFDAHIKLGLQAYDKYLTLTDQSLESRLRHADYLVYAKDWQQLQKEAAAMAKERGANERVLRYLGIAAYENKDYPAAENALNEWITKADPKRLLAIDYLDRGLAKVNVGLAATPPNTAKITEGITDLRKAVSMDSTGTSAEGVEDVAKALFTAKLYDLAGDVYEVAATNPSLSKSIPAYYYVGYSNYLHYALTYANDTTATREQGKPYLVKADTAFASVIKAAPTQYDAYYYRARLAKYADDPKNPTGSFVPAWEKYISMITTKTEPLTDTEKAHLVEGYNVLGGFYLPKSTFISDPAVSSDEKLAAIAKAEDYFNKTLALDANNAYAKAVLDGLGQYKAFVTAAPAPAPAPAK